MNPAYKILGALLLAIGLFSGGYYAHKPQTITKTKVEIQEKIVERRNVVTKTVVVGGTQTTTTVDHSVITSDTAASATAQAVVTGGGSDSWRPSYRLGVLINPAREYRDLTIGISIDF